MSGTPNNPFMPMFFFPPSVIPDVSVKCSKNITVRSIAAACMSRLNFRHHLETLKERTRCYQSAEIFCRAVVKGHRVVIFIFKTVSIVQEMHLPNVIIKFILNAFMDINSFV
jgi:hypothetical protein